MICFDVFSQLGRGNYYVVGLYLFGSSSSLWLFRVFRVVLPAHSYGNDSNNEGHDNDVAKRLRLGSVEIGAESDCERNSSLIWDGVNREKYLDHGWPDPISQSFASPSLFRFIPYVHKTVFFLQDCRVTRTTMIQATLKINESGNQKNCKERNTWPLGRPTFSHGVGWARCKLSVILTGLFLSVLLN